VLQNNFKILFSDYYSYDLVPLAVSVDLFCIRFSDVEPPDVLYNPQGYLLLSANDNKERMEAEHKMQMYVSLCISIFNISSDF